MADDAGVKVEGGSGEKPQVTVPAGPAPAGLVIHDLIEGEGEPTPAGAT